MTGMTLDLDPDDAPSIGSIVREQAGVDEGEFFAGLWDWAVDKFGDWPWDNIGAVAIIVAAIVAVLMFSTGGRD